MLCQVPLPLTFVRPVRSNLPSLSLSISALPTYGLMHFFDVIPSRCLFLPHRGCISPRSGTEGKDIYNHSSRATVCVILMRCRAWKCTHERLHTNGCAYRTGAGRHSMKQEPMLLIGPVRYRWRKTHTHRKWYFCLYVSRNGCRSSEDPGWVQLKDFLTTRMAFLLGALSWNLYLTLSVMSEDASVKIAPTWVYHHQPPVQHTVDDSLQI